MSETDTIDNIMDAFDSYNPADFQEGPWFPPNGSYNVVITKVATGNRQFGDRSVPYVKFSYEVIDGEYEGKKFSGPDYLFDNDLPANVTPEKLEAIKNARAQSMGRLKGNLRKVLGSDKWPEGMGFAEAIQQVQEIVGAGPVEATLKAYTSRPKSSDREYPSDTITRVTG